MPDEWIEPLAQCLACSKPDRLDDFRAFWDDWAAGRIPGCKITVVAWEGGPPLPCAGSAAHTGFTDGNPSLPTALGVVRLWESPYCGDKWFVEGLEVLESHRRRGIATKMMERAIRELRSMNATETLYAHVRDGNEASIRTLRRLGFVCVSQGHYISSCGEPRDNGSEYALSLAP